MIARRERIVAHAYAVCLGRVGEALTLGPISGALIGLMGLLAYLLREPLLFPSLGATVYLFLSTPLTPTASPRHAVIGHGVGIAAGSLSLACFGQLDQSKVLDLGMTPGRIGATALAIALTGVILILLGAAHPPAGATTLIAAASASSPHHTARWRCWPR